MRDDEKYKVGTLASPALLRWDPPMGSWQDIASAPGDRPILAQNISLPDHDPKRCVVVFSNHDNPTADDPGWHVPFLMEARPGLTHWIELPGRYIGPWLKD